MNLPRIDEDDDVLSRDHLDLLRDALSTPLPRSKEFLSITMPAPPEAAEKFLRLVSREKGFLWRSPSSGQLAGGGLAGSIRVGGPDRFATLARAVPALFATVHSVALDGAAPPPIVVGGAAFAPSVPSVEPWSEFTEDEFVLPRWGYRRHGPSGSMTLTVGREDLASGAAIDRFVEEARVLTKAFEYDAPTSLIERLDPTRVKVHHLSESDWCEYIDRIHAALASGEYEKIVAARRCVIDLGRQLEDTGFMARVFAAYPDCTHFAIRREVATFLGATPETLFRKQGLRIETHALAGTTRVSDDPRSESSRDAAALQSSTKDLDEHAIVVHRICSELRPLTTHIEHANAPTTRQVRNLIHLQTPITGELLPSTSAFDLLAALHPTPAVGGFPAREAAEWISKNEPLERGWYTGTVGWIDANGDSEFAVAIRCGVLAGTKAYVFAGAGVVAASDARAEYAETAGKMGPILRALGVFF